MMVIDYLNANRLSDPIQFQTVAEVVSVINTDFLGTDMDDVRNLNKDRRVMAAVPSVEFDARKIQRDFMDIVDDLRARLPVIAWLKVGDDQYHAVVITEVNREGTNHEITYMDPYYGQKTSDLDEFSKQWEGADKWLIRLKFGRKKEAQIEAFSQ